MVRDPVSLLLAISIPLFVGVMLKLLNSGGQPVAKLLVADQDRTFLSSMMLRVTEQGELAEVIQSEPASEADGRRLLDKGRASGLLIHG